MGSFRISYSTSAATCVATPLPPLPLPRFADAPLPLRRTLLLHHAAVPVRHIFTQANVADHHQVPHFPLDGPRGALHNSIIGPRPGSDFIFLLRQAKQDNSAQAQLLRFARLFHRFVHGNIEHARAWS